MNKGIGRYASPGKLVGVLARSHPARLTLIVFVILIFIFWGLLMLPIATYDGVSAPPMDALFTAISAVCVTGLTTVSTALFWSPFGQAVLVAAMYIGGLGVMTMASLLAFAVSRHLGLTQRMIMRESTSTGSLSDTGRIVLGVLVTSTVVQLIVFVFLSARFLIGGASIPVALWDGLFMAVSAFNNAGFLSVPNGLQSHIAEWGVLLPITFAALIGAIGFPVVTEIRRHWRTPRRWSLHTKLTLTVFSGFVAASIVATMALEWTNPNSMGSMTWSEKILGALLSGVNSRSLGLTVVPVEDMRPASQLLLDVFMFIGGGSASTAGGVKVTTFAVLILALVAEARGNNDVEVFRRRLTYGTVRLAVAVLVLSSLMIIGGVFTLLLVTDFDLNSLLFETISAYGTVGLSMGITPELPVAGKLVLGLVMLVGRLGPMTMATALALSQRHNLIRMPEARPIVG